MALSSSSKNSENVIEEQKNLIAHYEKKIVDVVSAYKGLLREKDALSVSLLEIVKDGNSKNSLKDSLAALLEEKSRNDVSYLKDKKKMMTKIEKMEKEKFQLIKKNEELKKDVNTSKNEMESLQKETMSLSQKSELRILVLEKQLESVVKSQENRVYLLETQVKELTSSLVEVEQQRVSESNLLARYRERILNLETENKTLVSKYCGNEFLEMDTTSLVDTIYRLKALLREREESLFIEDDNESGFSKENELIWKTKYFELKKDFEDINRGASHKTKCQDTGDKIEEILFLQKSVEDYKTLISRLRVSLVNSVSEKEEMENKLKELNDFIVTLKEKNSTEYISLESNFKKEICILEAELEAQRIRFLQVLSEKETNSLRDSSSSPSLILHYSEALAHKESELSCARQRIGEMEHSLRDHQRKLRVQEESSYREIKTLSQSLESVKKLSSFNNSESHYEYLKNVILNYMLSSESKARDHMLKAISSLLLFSPLETNQVRAFNKSFFSWS